MKCLIIGGAGFIGAHISSLLSETGRDVYVFGRHSVPARKLPQKVTYIAGDYSDRAKLRSTLVNASEVIDLAYSTVPKTSFEDPLFDILSNLSPGVTLLQESSRVNLKKFVFVSSGGTVYGKVDSLPINETHSTNPISPYGITKLTMEKYAGMFAVTAGLPVVIARPANAYGEDQVAFTGQGFISTAIQSVLQGKKIDIYGIQGTIRDYLHVTDIARGIISVLDHGETGQAYNIGSGIGRNNREVLSVVDPLALQAGLKIETNFLPERRFDVPANILNSQKLHDISDWELQVPFEEGIQKIWFNFLNQIKPTTGDR